MSFPELLKLPNAAPSVSRKPVIPRKTLGYQANISKRAGAIFQKKRPYRSQRRCCYFVNNGLTAGKLVPPTPENVYNVEGSNNPERRLVAEEGFLGEDFDGKKIHVFPTEWRFLLHLQLYLVTMV